MEQDRITIEGYKESEANNLTAKSEIDSLKMKLQFEMDRKSQSNQDFLGVAKLSNEEIMALKRENQSLLNRCTAAESRNSIITTEVEDMRRRCDKKDKEERLQLNPKVQSSFVSDEIGGESDIKLLSNLLKHSSIKRNNNQQEFYIINEFNAAQGIPPAPTMPRNTDPEVWQIFQKSDPYYTQLLDASQLISCLNNVMQPPLSIKTSKMIIRSIERASPFLAYEGFVRCMEVVDNYKRAFIILKNSEPKQPIQDSSGNNQRISLSSATPLIYPKPVPLPPTPSKPNALPVVEFKSALKECGIQIGKKVMELYLIKTNPIGKSASC